MEAKQNAAKQQIYHCRNQRGNQEIPKDKGKWKKPSKKSMGCSKSSSKMEVYSDTSLPQKTRKTS